jgi:RHS repeat-associated protein
VITTSTGAVAATNHYYPFGEWAGSTGSTPEPLRFTGHERDPGMSAGAADDLDYMHARYYHPQLGRFLGVDRVEGQPLIPQSWNRYVYTKNKPIIRVDPDGLEDVLIFKTERNPRRDPPDPWGKAANYLANKYKRTFAGKYATLNVKIIAVNRVSQVNKQLYSSSDIVKIAFVGHSDQAMIAVGSESKSDTNISSMGGPNDVNPGSLDWSNLKSEASIDIMGCHAGAGQDSIAQEVANASGVSVTAPDSYLNFDESTGEPFMRWFRFGKFRTLEPE